MAQGGAGRKSPGKIIPEKGNSGLTSREKAIGDPT
jgi:hypothetical protein